MIAVINFESFLSQAWDEHANNAQTVADRLQEGASLLEKNEQIIPLANLATHVFGEHLGKWKDGINFLASLRENKSFKLGTESEAAIERFTEALSIAAGNNLNTKLSRSDQVRALAIAASALSGQSAPVLAQQYFRKSLELAEPAFEKQDPANRALAVTGNNLACALEEKTNRSVADMELMILAAKTGRKYWEIAGGWLETERAEYRLANSYLQAGLLEDALVHATACLQIAEENNAPALEFFFGYEVLALVEKSRKNLKAFDQAHERMSEYFQQLSNEDKQWI